MRAVGMLLVAVLNPISCFAEDERVERVLDHLVEGETICHYTVYMGRISWTLHVCKSCIESYHTWSHFDIVVATQP